MVEGASGAGRRPAPLRIPGLVPGPVFDPGNASGLPPGKDTLANQSRNSYGELPALPLCTHLETVMPKVLIAPSTLAGVEGPYLRVLKEAGFQPVYPTVNRQMVEAELQAILPGVEASLAGSEPYTPAVLAAHPQLRVIARVGVGYDAVDVAAATERGVAVCFAPGTNQGSVAEHTFCLMLAWTRGLIAQHAGVKSGGWPRGTCLPLRGQTLGIAGLGRIGKAVATRAQAFEMKVIAHDPFPDAAWAQAHGIPLLPFEQLLREADFLSLHMPALPETNK